MEKHEEKRTLDTYIGTVVITYNPAAETMFGKISSNYTAALMVDDKPTCVAFGFTRETALFDLFCEYAKYQVPDMI